ncbi:C-GCAxxG-C-C family protein [Pseudodesulfovibrio sediminis]|uniref:C_GCAxxG_C_C family protein n=1 Tax=Pseudodesulfovibrio sediminis TaxID=2810563 RepID=A0ABN6EXF7_9BACT|nr:C-GCAxxG-C-C family protein [Pseudodesulfovibrio sediminis]BCS90228.1 hypothetical protein PSDVSF_34700 [Pseudodesulfovibrio sediminis]
MQHQQYEQVVEEAVQYGLDGCTCSESIGAAFGAWLGFDQGSMVGMCGGFAGGMGFSGETCGVVAAALLVIGVTFGPVSVEDAEARGRIKRLASEFVESFLRQNGSLVCRDLRGDVDMRSSDGREQLIRSGRPQELIRSGAALLAELVSREKERQRA